MPHKNFRVLEVGPGTGVFTRRIVDRMQGQGSLDLCEINALFVERLKQYIQTEATFTALRSRIRIMQMDPRELPGEHQYDTIISGLPFNNFSPEEVFSFLQHFRKLLRPGGTLAFFEYIAIRRLQYPFCGRQRRHSLGRIAKLVKTYAGEYQIDQHLVALNVPPARVRILQF
jgi:phospholipid N-methyltransferase